MTRPVEGVRVLLADDHAVVRYGFRLLLEGAGATVCGEAASGKEALAAFEQLAPDVLVMDVSMPGTGGLTALERLIARTPEARVLVLSVHDDLQIPMRALRGGARGYLSKRSDPSELIRAVAALARGERYLDPDLASRLALAQLDGATNPVATLTEKELAVFLQLARGESVAEIANVHHLSPSTVGTHLYHIKQKLNARNAAELTLIAVRAGLLET